MQPRLMPADAFAALLPLPDDESARDAKYAELVSLLDAWLSTPHDTEPSWEIDDLPRTRLRVPDDAS